MFEQGAGVKCKKKPANYGNWTIGKTYTVGTDDEFPNAICDDTGIAHSTAICDSINPALAAAAFFQCFELLKEIKMKSENKINYLVLNDSVVLNYDGKTVNVASSDERFEKVLACIREERLADIPAVVEIERRYNGDGIELRDGLLVANNEPLPSELEARILAFKDKKLPYAPLLKFWENLKKNPSFNSRRMLFKFLEHNGHPLTTDGCFIAYRGVTEDFKDVRTKTFDNKVGSVCEMPRSQVNDNPNETCSSGLHVACFDYANGFGSKLVEVKVNPADVVCVPVDYNGTKMRVCRFEVVAEGSVIKDTVLESFEDDQRETCEDCECEICTCEAEEEVVLTVKAAPKKKANLKVELNGKGKDRQLRHAVRGPNGTFVKSSG